MSNQNNLIHFLVKLTQSFKYASKIVLIKSNEIKKKPQKAIQKIGFNMANVSKKNIFQK